MNGKSTEQVFSGVRTDLGIHFYGVLIKRQNYWLMEEPPTAVIGSVFKFARLNCVDRYR